MVARRRVIDPPRATTLPAPMSEIRALLLTDVVDSTRIAEALGDPAMAAHWLAHDRAARDLLRTWRGREIEKTDGLLAVFDTAADAAGFALAYHGAIAALGLPFVARAGIHVGPLRVRESSADDVAAGAKRFDVDGLAKPVTARVMATALGGQTLLTGDARRALGGTLLRVQSHGHWRLKGLPEPVELFETGDESSPFKPPPDEDKAYRVVRMPNDADLWLPAREIPHSVPAERDSFVGREDALRDVARCLDDGARLVSVLGMGGTGKTRLVTRFAWAWLGEYPGGVWFCDLSPARTLDGIVVAVAQGLDVPLGTADPLVQLAHAIAGRARCLVILDNFEQVAKFAEGTLGRWLDRAPLARFIVTTREVLGVVGERIVALEPLPAAEAVELFVRRAEAASPGSTAGGADKVAIEQLVKVLDGLPLAVELAAARIRAMPPRTMLARMHERFNVLWSRAGRRDRQATLRAAFDWSWELLSEPEKLVLAQLSVFRGGFSAETAEAVLDLGAFARDTWSVDVVHWLVDKSFVRKVADDRFDLLESVRDYAAEPLRTEGRLSRSGPLAVAAAEARHGACFAGLSPEQATQRRCIELDNLVSACRRAIERHDTATAVATLRSARAAISMRGPYRLALELAQALQAMPGVVGPLQDEAELMLGASWQLCGNGTQAQQHLAAAAAGAQARGNLAGEARARQSLAPLLARAGRTDEAAAAFDMALRASRTLGDQAQECAVLSDLAAFSESLGHLDAARRHYDAGLKLANAIGHRRWEGGLAGNLAQFHANLGHTDEARALYAKAVAIARELGDRQWEANARCNLGLLHFTEGRLADAQTELEVAMDAARDMGYAQLLSIVQCNLGLVAEAQGAPDEARRHHTAAVEMARQLGDRRSEGQFLGYLGVLLARQGEFAEARECLAGGEALLRAVSDRMSLGILLCARAEAEARAGAPVAARALLQSADALAGEIGAVGDESELGLALRQARSLLTAVA